MDNLHHIDKLLRQASQAPANALVNDSDWAIVEKRLKLRKNRIYAVWFFLALISVCGIGLVFDTLPQNKTKTLQLSESINKADFDDESKENNYQFYALEDEIVKQQKRVAEISDTTEEREIAVLEALIHQTSEYLQADLDFDATMGASSKADRVNITTQDQLEKYQYTTYETILLSSKKVFANQIDGAHSAPTSVNRLAEMTKLIPRESYLDAINAEMKTDKYWEFGVSFTPGLTNKLTSENILLKGLINRNYTEAVANSESSSFANSFGFNVQYHNKSWFVATGIFRTQRGEQLEYNYQITEGVFETDQKTLDYIPLDPAAYESVVYSGSNSYHFLELPINVGHKMSVSRNFEVRSQLGVSYMALLSRQGKIGSFKTLQLQNITDLQFNQHNIAANVKIGAYWSKPNFTLGVEPTFGINLNTLRSAETSAIKTKPYGYGVNITSAVKLFKR